MHCSLTQASEAAAVWVKQTPSPRSGGVGTLTSRALPLPSLCSIPFAAHLPPPSDPLILWAFSRCVRPWRWQQGQGGAPLDELWEAQ